MKKERQKILFDGPMLDKVKVHFGPDVDFSAYPFCVPVIQQLCDIEFLTPVTFFVGENGTGKSTLLEALAVKAEFGVEGGSKSIAFTTTEKNVHESAYKLADHLMLSWRSKPSNGYFFRAESFFNLANYIDSLAREDARAYAPYGGISLHHQSHGESFLSFFENRLSTGGFFIFDEPEAALSPQRQLSLIRVIHELCKEKKSQFIIATHSPLLLAFPRATIYSCDSGKLTKITYEETQHYQITKDFLNAPEKYLRYLLKD